MKVPLIFAAGDANLELLVVNDVVILQALPNTQFDVHHLELHSIHQRSLLDGLLLVFLEGEISEMSTICLACSGVARTNSSRILKSVSSWFHQARG